MSATETRQEVQAVAKWVRVSPRKARLVIDHIRGRTVPEARTVLAFTSRAAARDIEKVLRSAVANAEANHGLIGDQLVVSTAHVDDGLTIKRWRARARGRVAPIKKRTCHITIKVSPVDGVVPAPLPQPVPEPVVVEAPEEPQPVAEEEQPQPVAEEKPKPKPKRAPRRKKTEEEEKSES
jgi:large subunit ribosomal protein L22